MRWSKTAEALRSLINSEIYADWSVADRAKLVSIEKIWQQFRETHCQEAIEPFKDGSAMVMVYHRCLAQLTNDRIADIQGVEVLPLLSELASTTLAEMLKKFDAREPVGQKQWEVYRSRQCPFESKQFSEQPMQLQICQNRLKKARIRQLSWMLNLR